MQASAYLLQPVRKPRFVARRLESVFRYVNERNACRAMARRRTATKGKAKAGDVLNFKYIARFSGAPRQ